LATDAKTRNAANDKKQIAIDLKIAFHHLIVVSSRVLNR
jgi:predicted nucleic acid-binding protein